MKPGSSFTLVIGLALAQVAIAQSSSPTYNTNGQAALFSGLTQVDGATAIDSSSTSGLDLSSARVRQTGPSVSDYDAWAVASATQIHATATATLDYSNYGPLSAQVSASAAISSITVLVSDPARTGQLAFMRIHANAAFDFFRMRDAQQSESLMLDATFGMSGVSSAVGIVASVGSGTRMHYWGSQSTTITEEGSFTSYVHSISSSGQIYPFLSNPNDAVGWYGEGMVISARTGGPVDVLILPFIFGSEVTFEFNASASVHSDYILGPGNGWGAVTVSSDLNGFEQAFEVLDLNGIPLTGFTLSTNLEASAIPEPATSSIILGFLVLSAAGTYRWRIGRSPQLARTNENRLSP